MLDTRSAYGILGLEAGASKAEIEKRYAVLLKKYKASRMQAENGEAAPDMNFNEITDAYNYLMGYSEGTEDTEAADRKPNPILKKLGIDEKKAGNFLYYYKIHIIIGIIVIIALSASLRSCINRVDPDLNLAFIGEFYYSESEEFQQNITNIFPEIKKVGIDGAVLSDKVGGDQIYAMQMKATVLFAAGDIDVYILDKPTFETFGKQGAFASLDDLADRLKVDKEKTLLLKPETETAENVYGIDISSSAIFNGTKIKGPQKIVALGVRSKHQDKALKLIELMLGAK